MSICCYEKQRNVISVKKGVLLSKERIKLLLVHAQDPSPEEKLNVLYVSQVPPLHPISSIHLHSLLPKHAFLASWRDEKPAINLSPHLFSAR